MVELEQPKEKVNSTETSRHLERLKPERLLFMEQIKRLDAEVFALRADRMLDDLTDPSRPWRYERGLVAREWAGGVHPRQP